MTVSSGPPHPLHLLPISLALYMETFLRVVFSALLSCLPHILASCILSQLYLYWDGWAAVLTLSCPKFSPGYCTFPSVWLSDWQHYSWTSHVVPQKAPAGCPHATDDPHVPGPKLSTLSSSSSHSFSSFPSTGLLSHIESTYTRASKSIPSVFPSSVFITITLPNTIPSLPPPVHYAHSYQRIPHQARLNHTALPETASVLAFLSSGYG